MINMVMTTGLRKIDSPTRPSSPPFIFFPFPFYIHYDLLLLNLQN